MEILKENSTGVARLAILFSSMITNQILIKHSDDTIDLNVYGYMCKFIAQVNVVDNKVRQHKNIRAESQPFNLNEVKDLAGSWAEFDNALERKITTLFNEELIKLPDSLVISS